MYSYRAFGLQVASEIELPELPTCPRASADVEIACGAIPDLPAFDTSLDRDVVLRGDDVYVHWPFLGTVLVSGGRRIHVAPGGPAAPETVRMAVLGVSMGVLLHQRGLFTLHASAVSIGGTAAAFVGWKGAGKSTLAATLQRRGHALVTDDVLAVDATSLAVHPAFPQIKLRGEAMQAIDAPHGEHNRLSPDVPKYDGCRTASFKSRSLPLGVVFVLDASDDGVSCERVQGRDAFLALMSQSYAPRFLGTEGVTPGFVDACSRLAREVAVVRLRRPYDLNRLADSAACVEQWTQAIVVRA